MPEETSQKHDESYDLMPEGAPFEHGFNMKTVWGALFVGFIMLPGAIYLGLVTGQSMAGGAEWVTIILFIEIAKRSFVRLKTQEIIILYWVAGGLVQMGGKLGSAANLFGGPFGTFIWDQYLIQSPQAIGLREYIPSWVCPNVKSEAFLHRSFMHRDWLLPVVILIMHIILMRICSLSMSYVLYRVTSDLEKLPFPMARVHAGGATALAETSGKQEGWRWRVFSIGSFVGAMFGLVYIVVPTMSSIFLTDTVTILPIPFIDFTPSIKAILPATALGINTNLGLILTGFVLPFWVVVGQFAGSMISALIVNPTLYKAGILHTWSPGMGSIPTRVCNQIDFWLSFTMGKTVLIALLGFGLVFQAFFKGRVHSWEDEKKEEKVSGKLPEGRGDLRLIWPLLFWAAGTGAYVAIVHILVPEFPWWICAIFGFIWTPIFSYITARMVGLTGSPQGVTFPYVREASFLLSGYKGASVWFAPIPMHNHGRGVEGFRQLELTRCKFGSRVRVTALNLVVMLFCSFLFWSMIWRLGPIPSSAYPFIQMMWPFHATFQAMWAKSTIPQKHVLYDFEGAVDEEWSGTAEHSRAEWTEKQPQRTARDSSHSLEVKFGAGAAQNMRFTEFREDWTGFRWYQFDVFNPGQRATAKLRLSSRAIEGRQGVFETPIAFEHGKNVVGVQLKAFGENPNEPEIEFKEQLPPRDRERTDPKQKLGSHVIYVRQDAVTENLRLEDMSSIDLIGQGEACTLHVDNLSLVGEARSFIFSIINWRYILVGFGVGTLLYTTLTFFGAPTLLFYGWVQGIVAWPHHSIPIFVGAMIGRYYFQSKFGEKKWKSYAPILLAGYACGFSLIGMTSIAIVLISKSISQVVF